MIASARLALARQQAPEFWAEYDAMHGLPRDEMTKPENQAKYERLSAEFARRIGEAGQTQTQTQT